MLELSDLHVAYGPVPAVRGISLEVAEGEAVAVLGRNGAGKSTTLLAIAGLQPPAAGRIVLDGVELTDRPAEQRVDYGVALAPEGRGIFPRLTVEENLRMGGYHRRLDRRAAREEIARVTERFPQLRERLDQRAGSLSGGEQQMLAIARGLMCAPRLLLIDEPSLGLAPVLVDELYTLLDGLRADGVTLLVVEQYVELALEFSDRAYVLDKGQVALAGDSTELAASEGLVDAYLAGTTGEDVA